MCYCFKNYINKNHLKHEICKKGDYETNMLHILFLSSPDTEVRFQHLAITIFSTLLYEISAVQKNLSVSPKYETLSKYYSHSTMAFSFILRNGSHIFDAYKK